MSRSRAPLPVPPPPLRTRARPRPARRRVPRVLPRVLLLAGALVGLLFPRPVAAGTDPVGVWPLDPEPAVVSGFDPPEEEWGAGHRGVDLLGSAGQQVRAALPGTVSFAGSLAGRGVVTVDHGATRTTYEPVAASVTVGRVVAAGTPIGTLQSGVSHCAPRVCLHWGWIEGVGTYLDPLRLVGAGPVRLLPLWRDVPVEAAPPLLRTPYAGWRPPPVPLAW